jgi:hypothetical protein
MQISSPPMKVRGAGRAAMAQRRAHARVAPGQELLAEKDASINELRETASPRAALATARRTGRPPAPPTSRARVASDRPLQVDILEIKISKLEQLVRLKDSKIATLQVRACRRPPAPPPKRGTPRPVTAGEAPASQRAMICPLVAAPHSHPLIERFAAVAVLCAVQGGCPIRVLSILSWKHAWKLLCALLRVCTRPSLAWRDVPQLAS